MVKGGATLKRNRKYVRKIAQKQRELKQAKKQFADAKRKLRTWKIQRLKELKRRKK